MSLSIQSRSVTVARAYSCAGRPTKIRHHRGCPSRGGGKCGGPCKPSYQAWVWSRRDGIKIKKSFPSPAAAKSWRSDALSALNKGLLQAPVKRTLREEALDWIEKAKAGEILTRSQARYKPAVLRGIEANLTSYVLDDLGGHRVSAVTRRDVQALVDRLTGRGLSGSSVRNVVNAMKVVYRRVLENDELTLNPTANLRLPAAAGTRDRAAAPDEVADLLASLADTDRALWATAAYAGLRRGELRALRWDDVDLAENVIHVRRGWDEKEGPIEPKSPKGCRRVPIVAALRLQLLQHKARTGRRDEDLVFGSAARSPFTPTNIRKRALTAWKAENAKRKEAKKPALVPIGLHELRHSYVSMLHAGGSPSKRSATTSGIRPRT